LTKKHFIRNLHLWTHQKLSKRRNLLYRQSAEAGGNFNPIKYCWRISQKKHKGIYTILICFPWFRSWIGNSADYFHEFKLYQWKWCR